MNYLTMSGIDPLEFGAASFDAGAVGRAIAAAAPQKAPWAPQQLSPLALAAATSAQETRKVQLETRALAGRVPTIPLGIDSVALIAALTAQAINVIPTTAVRIVGMSVANSIAPSFIINSILVGRLNLLDSGAAIPAEMYSGVANDMSLESPAIPAGTIIVVNVTNISGGGLRFLAGFKCVDLSVNV